MYGVSVLAATVAQTCSLPYRRFLTCQLSRASNVPPITNRRYGRLKICATLNTYSGILPEGSRHCLLAKRWQHRLADISMNRATKLLRELIALPSVNPAFLPANDPRAGEQKVADFLAATAERNGLEVELHEVFPGRSNLLARLAASRKARLRILLAPHMDT